MAFYSVSIGLVLSVSSHTKYDIVSGRGKLGLIVFVLQFSNKSYWRTTNASLLDNVSSSITPDRPHFEPSGFPLLNLTCSSQATPINYACSRSSGPMVCLRTWTSNTQHAVVCSDTTVMLYLGVASLSSGLDKISSPKYPPAFSVDLSV